MFKRAEQYIDKNGFVKTFEQLIDQIEEKSGVCNCNEKWNDNDNTLNRLENEINNLKNNNTSSSTNGNVSNATVDYTAHEMSSNGISEKQKNDSLTNLFSNYDMAMIQFAILIQTCGLNDLVQYPVTLNIVKAAKNMYNKYEYTQPSLTTEQEIPNMIELLNNNILQNQLVIEDVLSTANTANSKSSSNSNSITSLETRMTDVETKVNGLNVSCSCDTEANNLRFTTMSTNISKNDDRISQLRTMVEDLKTNLLKDLDYIWGQLRAIHTDLPEIKEDPSGNGDTTMYWNVSDVDTLLV